MGQDRPLGDGMAHVAAMLEGELPAADVAVYRRYGGAKLDPVVGPTGLLSMLDAAAFEGTPWHTAFTEPGTVVEHRVEELPAPLRGIRSEEHTSELQSLMRISYAVFCLKKKNTNPSNQSH